jgi:hypothetical protein
MADRNRDRERQREQRQAERRAQRQARRAQRAGGRRDPAGRERRDVDLSEGGPRGARDRGGGGAPRWRGPRGRGMRGARGGGGSGIGILIVIVLVIAIGVGIWFFATRDDAGTTEPTVSATPTAAVSPAS